MFANEVALLKSAVLHESGHTQAAYDSLVAVEAKTPDDNVQAALAKYGALLGKNKEQVEKDLWTAREKFIVKAPAFELGLYTSRKTASLADFRGKVVLLTFWFPGCGPCRGEFPHFENVLKKFKGKDVVYLGINVFPEQDDYVLPFMQGTKYSFIPLRGNAKWAEATYKVRGEPTNFLIDGEGRIVFSNFMIHGDNERMLELMIAAMLSKNNQPARVKYTIDGKVGNMGDPAKMYLRYTVDEESRIDSVVMKNGAFSFSGSLAEPVRATLLLFHQGVQPARNFDGQVVFLDNGAIHVNSKDSVKNAVITGSKLNDDYNKLQQLLKPLNDKSQPLMQAYRQLTAEQKKDKTIMDEFEKKFDAISEERRGIYKNFIAAHPSSFVSLDMLPMAVGSVPDYNELAPLFNSLSVELKNSAEGKKMNERLTRMKSIAIGSMAPDFTQNDTSGLPVKLSAFRGKYVLVDFWASWCGPCRAENPNLVKSYNKFKDKNFTVLGVSLDQPNGREKWLKAIADDRLFWTHVSDLAYWKNAAAKLYDVHAIPQNFLVDPSGRIIARDLRGEDLEKKLAELLN